MHASAFGHASGMPNGMLNPASCQALCVCLQYSRLATFKVGVTLPKCLFNGRKPVHRHSCQTCIVKTYCNLQVTNCNSPDLPVPVQQAEATTSYVQLSNSYCVAMLCQRDDVLAYTQANGLPKGVFRWKNDPFTPFHVFKSASWSRLWLRMNRFTVWCVISSQSCMFDQ